MRNVGIIIGVYIIYLLIFAIHRDTLRECMKEFKIPAKLIIMCKTCLQKTRSEVRIEGTLSTFF
jgi:hypothetical protein